jgi:branched-chain amino acid transport system permease protein
MSLLVGGLAIGAIYALVAIGIVLIFRTTNIVNFAQGELLMTGAYAYALLQEGGANTNVAFVGALAAGALCGLLCFVVTHVFLRRASEFGVGIGTLALLILMQSIARHLFTDDPRAVQAWLVGAAVVQLGATAVTANALLTLGITVVVSLALFAWLRSTLFGQAMRAVAESRPRAALTGISVPRTLAVSWMTGGALAALGGVMLAPITGAYPTIGSSVLFAAFFATVLGGFHSLIGALIGGLLLGLVETYANVYFGSAYRNIVIFVVLVGVLVIRPQGIVGIFRMRTV